MYEELIYKLEELVCDRIKDTDDAMLVCDAINAINNCPEYGLADGYCIMSIRRLSDA